MNNNIEMIIGIEIHLELNTKTKMFSPVLNEFNAEPNTLVSPIDLGYPGTLPLVNKEAVRKAIQLGKALNMKIDNELHFDRKNYYYTDLPKGFQITQQFRPIGSSGVLELTNGNKIQIERIHLEEDTARQQHNEDNTLINYNRAGVPLIEIVSCPDIRSAEEAVEYIESMRLISLFLNISDAIMAEGSLRADINLSTRLKGSKEFGTKVEIKNLNSINNIKKAIEYEFNLQCVKIMNNEEIVQQTKRFDEATNQTVAMRDKTDAIDYRYFPEPNIPVIQLDQSFIDGIKKSELPNEMRKRYLDQNIPSEFVEQIINNLDYAKFLDLIPSSIISEATKIFFSEMVPLAIKSQVKIHDLNIKTNDFVKAIELVEKGLISGKQLKVLIPKLQNLDIEVDELVVREKMQLISDPKIILAWIDEIKQKNPNLVNDFIEREERTIKFIAGEVMKLSKGQANPILTIEIIKKDLK